MATLTPQVNLAMNTIDDDFEKEKAAPSPALTSCSTDVGDVSPMLMCAADPQTPRSADMFDTANLKPRKVPVQLRVTGDAGDGGLSGEGSRMLIDTRIRKGPYWHLSQEAGAWCYTVYNKIYHPRAYIKPEDGGLAKEYEYLTNHVAMFNVAVERQIQVKGPDAGKFVNYVVTRNAELCQTGQCKYVILCNPKGGILCDPILLRPYEDEWWFSLADADIGLYLQGVNHDGRFDCEINEIDVAPVQIQGPKSTALMQDIFGEEVTKMKHYGLMHSEIAGCKCVISATGFSAEKGYEIFLYDATKNAEKMWSTIMEAGKAHNLRECAVNHNRRIEAGILSYGADMDQENNPYEVGLGWQVDLKKDSFIGRAALEKIKAEGVTHKLAGLKFGGEPITWYASDFYNVFNSDNELVGYVTSCWWSPTQESNIGYAMLPISLTPLGTELHVELPNLYRSDINVPRVRAVVEKTPFKPPAKGSEGTALRETGTKL